MYQISNQQQLAIESNSPKILCLASAGAGKTFTLIERISRLSKFVDPRSILALTFTNAAAFEMKERYRSMHTNETIPEFRTFHSFCYNLLVNDEDVLHALKYHKVPRIIDTDYLKRIQRTARTQLNFRISESKMKDKSKLSFKELAEIDTYNKLVSQKLKRNNYITFDILVQIVTDLFLSNAQCIQKYKDRYKYIFVDEFQDTDTMQWEFAQSFTNAKLFVCGDALQAIYGFRGANSSIIKQLANDDTWDTIILDHNYRSTKQICDYANNMSNYADESYRLIMQTDKSGPYVLEDYWGSVPYMHPIDTVVLDRIIENLDSTEGTTAILCRTNNEIDTILSYMKSKNISVSSNPNNDESQNICKCVFDNEYAADWLSTFLDADSYTDYIRLITLNPDKSHIKVLVENYGDRKNINSRLYTIISIRRILKDTSMDIITKIKTIIKTLGYEIKNIEIADSIKCSKDLVNFCLDCIVNYNHNKVYVGTVHSVKGLEFDSVYLLGVNGYTWKLNTEENQNLFYVGITRAKTHLYVYKGEWR